MAMFSTMRPGRVSKPPRALCKCDRLKAALPANVLKCLVYRRHVVYRRDLLRRRSKQTHYLGQSPDSRLSEVDSFKVIIDSFLDRQNGFIFGTTPGQVEYDGQVVKEGSSRFGSGGGGFNKNWDAAWVVQAQVSEQGWSRVRHSI